MAMPLLALALASEKETPVQKVRRHLQVAARIVNKTRNFGRCEGDCSTNADCQTGLVCFQRNAGDSVPGCTLSSSLRNSRADFCIARPGGPVATPVRAPLRAPTPVATPVRAPTPVAAPVRAPVQVPTGGTRATYVGNNNVSNLGACQGDCDRYVSLVLLIAGACGFFSFFS